MLIPTLTLIISLAGCKPNLDEAKSSTDHYIEGIGLNEYIDNIANDDLSEPSIINHNEVWFSESPIRQNDIIFPAIMITAPTNMDEYEQMLKNLLMNSAGYFYTPYTL